MFFELRVFLLSVFAASRSERAIAKTKTSASRRLFYCVVDLVHFIQLFRRVFQFEISDVRVGNLGLRSGQEFSSARKNNLEIRYFRAFVTFQRFAADVFFVGIARKT